MDMRTVGLIAIVAAFVALLPFGCHEITVHMRWNQCVNARAAAKQDIGICDDLLER